jgi:SH3 domain-containing YSC84-like protein 1
MIFRFVSLLSTMAIVITASTAPPSVLAASDVTIETVKESAKVYETVMAGRRTRIPSQVLSQAQGIAIIPNVIKAGFIVGGSRGKGLLVLRDRNGNWSNPVFLSLTSGSVGLQAGGQSSDIILVFRNQASIDAALTHGFTVGGSVSVAAGPIGGDPVSPTDAQTEADIYAYAMNKGLFAGLTVEGAKVDVDRSRNQDFYGQRYITVQQIISDAGVAVPPEVRKLHKALQQGAVAAAEADQVNQAIQAAEAGTVDSGSSPMPTPSPINPANPQ